MVRATPIAPQPIAELEGRSSRAAGTATSAKAARARGAAAAGPRIGRRPAPPAVNVPMMVLWRHHRYIHAGPCSGWAAGAGAGGDAGTSGAIEANVYLPPAFRTAYSWAIH